ncbi:MAG: pyruvate kinase [Bacteroidia bacterium]
MEAQYYQFNRTKIVATIGPACEDKKVLMEMIRQGLDVVRLNFSHADHETHERYVNLVREINDEHKTKVALLQDLQGPKMRIAKLERSVKIAAGDIITIRTDIEQQTEDEIPIVYDTFAKDVNEGDLILIDDGKVELTVVETDKLNTVKLRVEAGDEIKSRKGVNLPFTKISEPTITDQDYRDIDFAIKHKVEWIALSFVRSANDIRVLKELIRLKGGKSRVIAKIEKPEALVDIDAIIEESDGIMVARGDMGVEIPLEDVPMWQKRIVKKCNLAAKPVIVATQVMESMIENRRPTRAETNDVANAVLDGADAVMLSAETSVGRYPVDVIRVMSSIIRKVEAVDDSNLYYRNLQFDANGRNPLSAATIVTACTLARDTKAKCIIGMTHSGHTAFQLSHCRPQAHIFIFTDNIQLMHTLSLTWGVRAFYYDKHESTDNTISEVTNFLKVKGYVQKDDVVINTASIPIHERGVTNMVKITKIK